MKPAVFMLFCAIATSIAELIMGIAELRQVVVKMRLHCWKNVTDFCQNTTQKISSHSCLGLSLRPENPISTKAQVKVHKTNQQTLLLNILKKRKTMNRVETIGVAHAAVMHSFLMNCGKKTISTRGGRCILPLSHQRRDNR